MADNICGLLDKLRAGLMEEVAAKIPAAEHIISISDIEISIRVEPKLGDIDIRVRKWRDHEEKRTAHLHIKLDELPITEPGMEYNEFHLELARRPIGTSRPSEDLT
jgi:hypothetical protein